MARFNLYNVNVLKINKLCKTSYSIFVPKYKL